MSDDARPTTSQTTPSSPAALPDDLVILRQMVVELLAALRERQRENEQLQHRLDLLLRRLYGPRTERVDPNQLLLIPDALDAAVPETPDTSATAPPESAPPPETATEKKKSRPHGRRPLPKGLPRVERVYELTEAERCCPECGTTRVPVSAERSEQLDYKPASLFVK